MFRFIWPRKTESKQIKYKIAVLTKVKDVSAQKIIKGISETLRERDPDAEYYIKVYDAQMNRIVLREYVDEILYSPFDLLCTLDTDSAVMAHEISESEKRTMPVVFCGIDDPEKYGVVASLESSGNNFTGIRANYDYAFQIDLFCILRPDTYRALLVYDPTGQCGHVGDVITKRVEDAFFRNGVRVKHVQVFNSDEIVPKIEKHVPNADVVMVFNDGLVDHKIACLVKLCNKYRVNLCGSARQIAEEGAAIALGYDCYYVGTVVAKKALKILIDGTKPTDIPVASSEEGVRLILNIQASKKQNLNINKHLLALISNGRVINGGFRK